MKRIAALGATVIGLLAIPTAAMASTGSSGGSGAGSGYDRTMSVSVQPKECYVGYDQVHQYSQKYYEWWENGREFTAPVCPFSEQIPLPSPKVCEKQLLTFSVAADSHALTEVSGPELWPTEQFIYDGNVYTIMSINPGADQFTAFVNNLLFTNNSSDAITNAVGVIISCSS
jgi:hypothetical protein